MAIYYLVQATVTHTADNGHGGVTKVPHRVPPFLLPNVRVPVAGDRAVPDVLRRPS